MYAYILDLAGLLPATGATIQFDTAGVNVSLAPTFTVVANPQTTAANAAAALNNNSNANLGTIAASSFGRFLVLQTSFAPAGVTNIVVNSGAVLQPQLSYGAVTLAGSSASSPAPSSSTPASTSSTLLAALGGAVAGFLLAKEG